METLKIRYTDIGEDYVVAEMPVTSTVYQPMGLLHGGGELRPVAARARQARGADGGAGQAGRGWTRRCRSLITKCSGSARSRVCLPGSARP